jgi:hypothetical protein
MTTKLKMWIGNFDGSRQGLVIASTKEKARQIIGTSRSDFDGHWTQQPAVDQTLEPEVFYTRALSRRYETPAPWYRGRCPLIATEDK